MPGLSHCDYTAILSMEDEYRDKLKVELDTRTALLYGLSYEEYQAVLKSFPLVDE